MGQKLSESNPGDPALYECSGPVSFQKKTCEALLDVKSVIEFHQERIMTKTITTRYDVAEHLRTPEEMAAYWKRASKTHLEMLLSLPRHWEILPSPRACLKRPVTRVRLSDGWTGSPK